MYKRQGKYLLNSRGIECNWQPTDNTDVYKRQVQSRGYEKKLEDGTVLNKVAYEVSVISMEVINQKNNEEENSTQEAI